VSSPHFLRWLCALLALIVAGCDSAAFYSQAIQGQLKIMTSAQPIQALLEQPDTDANLKKQLELVLQLRTFAQQELQLVVGSHYSQYVDLQRPYVVWNVVAAPADGIDPKTWCFPIAGCVPYRGYFDPNGAHQYAEQLTQQGWHTYVSGIRAFSTLGWFKDPVLNSFVFDEEAELAALLFHELAHQQLYIKNDATFNESYATAVQLIGLQRWLAKSGQGQDFERHLEQFQRREQFTQLILEHRQLRQRRYQNLASSISIDEINTELASQLRASYAALKASWGGYAGYDRWFAGPLNNAQLSTIATYQTLVPGLIGIYLRENKDLSRFYAACQALAQTEKNARHQAILELGSDLQNPGLYSLITR
jgi:predicted aminopeptidase